MIRRPPTGRPPAPGAGNARPDDRGTAGVSGLPIAPAIEAARTPDPRPHRAGRDRGRNGAPQELRTETGRARRGAPNDLGTRPPPLLRRARPPVARHRPALPAGPPTRRTGPAEQDRAAEGRAAGRSRNRQGLQSPDRADAGDRSRADARAPRPRRARFGIGNRTAPGRNSVREPGRLAAARRMTRDRTDLRSGAGRSTVAIGPYCRQGRRGAGLDLPNKIGPQKAAPPGDRGTAEVSGLPFAPPPEVAAARTPDPRRHRARFGIGDRNEPRRNSARTRGGLPAACRTTRHRPGLRSVADCSTVAVGPYCRQGRRRAFEELKRTANEAAQSRRRERGAGPARGTPLAEPALGSAAT